VYQALLADAKFHEQLLVFDRDLAASARAARCWLCGGALHSASYDRKPRGCPGGLCREYAERFSFCCAVDGCRKLQNLGSGTGKPIKFPDQKPIRKRDPAQDGPSGPTANRRRTPCAACRSRV
jgi:hypothetical protein